MTDRNIYLQTVEAKEAVGTAINALDRHELVKSTLVPVHESLGRVTAKAVYARCSSPTYHSAAMDGVALKAEATFQAREGSPLSLTEGKDFAWVNTGNVLPEGSNAVIKIEDVVKTEGGIELEAPAFPWQNVRRIGEDIVATEMLMPQNRTLTPYDIGALLSAGIWEVEVWEKIRIAFIPTGDEVLDFQDRPTPTPGQVIESNSQVLGAIAGKWNSVFSRLPIVQDKPGKLEDAVKKALEQDYHIVVVGAGSSAGSKDYTRKVFAALGKVLVHGIKTMPGKPTLLGAANGKLLVGAPGYPVSAVVCFEDVLAPIVAWLGRDFPPERRTTKVHMARNVPSKLGMEEVMRLAVGRVGTNHVAVPLQRGAGMITTLTKAQAITRIPPDSEGISEGQRVDAELLVPVKSLENVLIHVGSHDNTLDVLSNMLMGCSPACRLVSSHVGSMGGLNAIKAGSAHMAGCHLLDTETGDFNFSFLQKYLTDMDLAVVNLAIRHQGLIVAKGNPLGIEGTSDLKRDDVRFINRQRGAGTRILLDYELDKAGIKEDEVNGYDREEFTHMAVAVNVLSGAADCGLGIMAAAKALDLGFVPMARERYDLVIPMAFMDDPKIASLLEIVRSKDFINQLQGLGGYDTDLTGQEMRSGIGLG